MNDIRAWGVTDGVALLFLAFDQSTALDWVLDAKAEHSNLGNVPPQYHVVQLSPDS